MNQERTIGVVLRTRRLTETSLIVQWLTPDLGRVATVAKGALRPKSPFRGQVDLFYEADFCFARSKRSELHVLREVKLVEPHAMLRQELAWIEQASYCAGLIGQTTETETPLPRVFEDFTGLLKELPKEPAQPQTIFAFEMKLLNELGLAPDLEGAKLSAGVKRLLEKLQESPWPMVFRLRLSPQQESEIRAYLQSFLVYHLDKAPKGRAGALRPPGL